MDNDLMKTAGSVTSDILSLFGIPTSTIQELWRQHQENVLSASRDVLFDEIEQGNTYNIAADDKISMLHRYTQAAMNGAARLNLRLLAKTINSLAKGANENNPLYANEFNRYAAALESLSHEEVNLLAQLYDIRKRDEDELKVFDDSKLRSYAHYYATLLYSLEYSNTAQIAEVKAMACSLQRTGLLYQTVDSKGAIVYALSPFFDKVIELADFQAALDKETNNN